MNFDHVDTVLVLNEIRNDVPVLSSGEACNCTDYLGKHDVHYYRLSYYAHTLRNSKERLPP